MHNPILTISILISGEYNDVKRCLDSIQPLMRLVPSELILTDTGCKSEVLQADRAVHGPDYGVYLDQ